MAIIVYTNLRQEILGVSIIMPCTDKNKIWGQRKKHWKNTRVNFTQCTKALFLHRLNLIKHFQVCPWGCFQRLLDHEGSGLRNGLIRWWLHNMTALLGTREGGGKAWLEDSMALGTKSWPGASSCVCFFFLSNYGYMNHSAPPVIASWQTDTSETKGHN